MAERNSLLNCRTGNGTAGSNPASSAKTTKSSTNVELFLFFNFRLSDLIKIPSQNNVRMKVVSILFSFYLTLIPFFLYEIKHLIYNDMTDTRYRPYHIVFRPDLTYLNSLFD